MSSFETSLSDVIHRVVETVDPVEILLFGSYARGEQTSSSDIDLMVLIADEDRRLEALQDLYGLGIPGVDFLVSTPAQFAARRDNANYVHHDVARDGRSVYAA